MSIYRYINTYKLSNKNSIWSSLIDIVVYVLKLIKQKKQNLGQSFTCLHISKIRLSTCNK